MSRTCRYLTQLGLLVVVLAVSGCPLLKPPPQLQVTPQSLVLNADVGVGSFHISNAGGGTLQWEVREDIPWLTLTERGALKQTSDAGPLTGTTVSETDTLDVVIDREQLALGLNQGQIFITSNGGSRTVEVSTTLVGTATLAVEPLAIDLGNALDTATFTVANQGANRLDWTASVEGGTSSWLSLLQQSGSIEAGGPTVQVGLLADRGVLSSGTHTERVNVESNGGSATITVSIEVETIAFSPASLDFGAILAPASRFLRIQNMGPAAVTVNLSVVESVGSGWLAVTGDTVVVPAAGQQDIALTADPAGLDPGLYQGELHLAAPSENFEATVPVSMEVAQFIVTPTDIDFGALVSPGNVVITLRNIGAENIDWQLGGTALSAPWLSVAPQSGSVAGNDTGTFTVTVDPASLAAGVHEVQFSVIFTGGEETITLRVTRPRDAELRLGKSEYAFGTVRNRAEQFLDILHAGDMGSINWSISTAGFPAWLRLEGTLTGTLNPEQVATVTIVVDRALAPPEGGLELEYIFEVVASGDFEGVLPVHVSMRTPRDPKIEIEADGVDQTDRAYLNIDVGEDARNFIIRNVGDAPLLWQIDLESLPEWITSITPAQATLEPNVQQTVTVNVDRTNLDFTGGQVEILIASDDPNRPSVPLLIEIQVPKVVIAGTRQASLSFGLENTTMILEVANLGDPDTDLNFQITSNKEWLAAFPDTGKSVGVAGPFKDWVPVNVTVDRAQLEGGGASAKLTVTAFVREGDQNIPRDDVEPVEVDVSVVAAELTFEVAQPRRRIPSLVRYELLMRNKRFQPIPLPDARLDEIASLFGIKEKDVSIEPDETNQFLTPIRNVKASALILLDYSGSMLAAAQQLVEDGQLPGTTDDPLQALYEKTISRLIDELPDNYEIALGVFNERESGGVRVIAPADGAPEFTRNKDILQARLDGIAVIDHGATELLPAFDEAAVILDKHDEDLIAFDDTALRLILCVTDGRLTTPPGDITQTIDRMYNARARLFAVGWGDGVSADPLIRVATATGGHYYATQNRDTGERDPFGAPIRLPVLNELLAWCVSDPLIDIGEEIEAAFDSLDENRNGTLSLDEALRFTPTVSASEFDALDADNSGLLDLDEARGKYRHLDEASFTALNADGNGGLDLDEAQGILPPLTVDDFADILDLDFDGELTPQELAAAIGCDQSIARDLKSQVVLSYVTLNENPSITVEADLSFDDPNDQNSPCLGEQGSITGSFRHSLLNFAEIVGDPRLGQIGMTAKGRDTDGSPVVIVRAEYIPRNITQLAFKITSVQPFSVTQVPPLSGGIISDWTPAFYAANDTYTYTSPDGSPLDFANFGDLLEIRFNPGAPASFDLDLEVVSPVFNASEPDGKYFTHPDRITVTDEGFQATAFPRPWLTVTPALQGTRDEPFIDLGSDTAQARIDIANLGGSHPETLVGLYWELISGGGPVTFQDASGIPEGNLPEGILGFLTTSKTSDTFFILPDRKSLGPGTYTADFYLGYIFGSLGLESESPVITVFFDVLPPELSVSTAALDFGTDLIDLPVTVTNTGQSLLEWRFDTTIFPFWLGATQTTGALGPGESDTFNIRISRNVAAPGDYEFNLGVIVDSLGQTHFINVVMTVPAP